MPFRVVLTQSPCRSFVAAWLLLAAAITGPVWSQSHSVSTPAAETAGFERRIQDRLIDNPRDADAWQTLGRLWLEQGQTSRAEEALELVLELDPLNAAARYDLGRLEQSREDYEAAYAHFETVTVLSPESEYALKAAEQMDAVSQQMSVVPVGYEIRRFDAVSPPSVEEREAAAESERTIDYSLSVDLGTVFDSNVALTPTSRGLSPGTSDSFQLLLAPQAEIALWTNSVLRAGPTLAGNFTLNEGNFQQFNLQSYQGGLFIEGDRLDPTGTYVPRITANYTYDMFQAQTFARRTAIVPSLIRYWSDDEATSLYWSIDYTDFAADGGVPSITSRDGLTNILGLTHDLALPYRHLRLARAGFRVERADTTGSDATFNGVGLSAQIIAPVIRGTELTLRGGWGYRDYPDFISGPSRHEHIWSAAGELRHYFTRQLSTAAVVTWDRFDSSYALYTANRLVAGLLLSYER